MKDTAPEVALQPTYNKGSDFHFRLPTSPWQHAEGGEEEEEEAAGGNLGPAAVPPGRRPFSLVSPGRGSARARRALSTAAAAVGGGGGAGDARVAGLQQALLCRRDSGQLLGSCTSSGGAGMRWPWEAGAGQRHVYSSSGGSSSSREQARRGGSCACGCPAHQPGSAACRQQHVAAPAHADEDDRLLASLQRLCI